MDRYRTLCFAQWTGTGMFAFGSWQGTAGSQRLELTVANVGTTGYHCKELPVPRGWNSWFPTWEPWVTIARNCRFPEVGTHGSQPGNQRLPLQATAGYQRLELMLPKKTLLIPKSLGHPRCSPNTCVTCRCEFKTVSNCFGVVFN